MDKSNIPGWYFPTTVCFVDDNRNFLKSLKLRLDLKKLTPRVFDDPLKAIQYLQTQPRQSSTIERCLSESTDRARHHGIDVDVGALHEEIYNQARFEEVSVVVADYAMPSLKGLDFCAQVRASNKRFKILMLTGEADERVAVEAFNLGAIDKFIRKDAPDFQQLLNHSIHTLQKSYFQGLTEMALSDLNNDFSQAVAPGLNDPAFISVFNEICQKNEISEYYLIDTDGSFLMLDFNGKPMWLIVKTAESMEDAYQIALTADKPFAPDLLAAMKKNEKLLFLYKKEICDDPAEAEKIAYPAHKISGLQTYYYAFIKDQKVYDIQPKEILSHKAYLDTLGGAD